MNRLQKRSAVGDKARVGTFYNARDDQFLSAGLFNDSTPTQAIQVIAIGTHNVRSDDDASYGGKFRMLGVEPALAATILAGWLDCEGSFIVLEEQRGRNNDWSALYHTVLTVEEKLNLNCPAIHDCLKARSLRDVTHIVTGVQWGLRTVITVQVPLGENTKRGNLKTQMSGFKAATESMSSRHDRDSCYLPESDEFLDIMAYSDMLQANGIILKDLREAYEFVQILPLHIKDENSGKGKPVTYSLIPIEVVGYFLQAQIPVAPSLSLPREDFLMSFVQLFDGFQTCRQRLLECTSYVASKSHYLLRDQVDIYESCLQRLTTAELALKTKFPLAVRSARHSGDQAELQQLLDEYVGGDSSLSKIANVDTSDLDAVSVLDELVSEGATYVGGDDSMLRKEIARCEEAYVLHFDRFGLTTDLNSWPRNYKRFIELLKLSSKETSTLYAIYDSSAAKEPFREDTHISHYQPGKKVTPDLLELEQFMSEQCFAKCAPRTFDKNDVQKPVKRRFVTIPCPFPICNQQTDCNWTCPYCLEAIEYGYVDEHFYCDCGRSKFFNYEFRCNDPAHTSGSKFSRHDPAVLRKLLDNLGSSKYVNVLILGETGVGKSTFINAMVNYLEFATLDDALAPVDLQWIVPCSFFTQFMNRAEADAEIEEHFICVGSRDDEKDGSRGDSATQKTSVYPVTISSGSTSYTVRLIDTPGIGDTRGPEFDKKNMADILTTISSYDELHGVLILLKPNNSRLTITFQYCVKELLVHLHQSAARNMVFGFTNTRITNYTPGDTLQPLKRLLGENTNVGITLSANTTYCFDSESFRYLAASKNGIDMGNKDDFDRSWRHSRAETVRLIEHFKSVPAHLTKSTISLNGARTSIQGLTKPMAEISELIRKNIAFGTDQLAELSNKRLTGDQLRNSLHIQKIQLQAEPLARPRTVCAHTNCTEIRDNGQGRNEKVTVYKTHCHAICDLTNVPSDVLAPAALIDCAAFGGSNHCSTCRHHWQEHMHILYELKEHFVTVIDSTVEQQLRDHANDITLRHTAIQNLNQRISEYEEEQDIIRKAAAKFGVFLKKHSITPINDATEEYLKFLIKAEKDKVDVGGNDTKLKALEENLQRHKEIIDVLTRSIDSGTMSMADDEDMTEAGVERMVCMLYSLKHFGTNLQSLQHGISLAHEATNREIRLPVKRNPITATGRRPRKLEIRSHQHANRDLGSPFSISKMVRKGVSDFFRR